MNIYIINGPNLNLLGIREPEHYGSIKYQDLCTNLTSTSNNLKMNSTIRQSNYEGEIVEFIHEAIRVEYDGIIINPAAYSHTSIAILDALKCFAGPIIEVHMSDVSNRESFRQTLITKQASDEMISGHGVEGYIKALELMKGWLDNE